MNRRDFFNYYILNIAILWNVSDFYMGDVSVSLLGLPIVLLGRLFYHFSPDLFYVASIILYLLVIAITFVGLKVIPIERFYKLLLPKILGFTIALFYVKIKIINLVLVSVTYNLLYKIIFKQAMSKDLVNSWLKDFLGLNPFWERFLLLFLAAFSAGICTNLCYNFAKLFSLAL